MKPSVKSSFPHILAGLVLETAVILEINTGNNVGYFLIVLPILPLTENCVSTSDDASEGLSDRLYFLVIYLLYILIYI